MEDKTEEEKEAIKQKYANKQAIVESDDRIDKIAQDLLDHYKSKYTPKGLKPQVVCVSREAASNIIFALNKYEGYQAMNWKPESSFQATQR